MTTTLIVQAHRERNNAFDLGGGEKGRKNSSHSRDER
jgi:hypothetical protein